MDKSQYALPPSSNNGTGSVSSASASAVEPVIIVDLPQLEGRISPGLSPMDIKNISLRELVEYCLREHDEDAWREFDRRMRPTVRGVVAKRLRCCNVNATNELVGEITQDTFLNLLNHDHRALRKEWADDHCIFKFVKVVGNNAVVTWLRKNKVLKDPHEIDDQQELRVNPTPDTAEKEILRDQVERCLQTLASDPNFKRNHAIFWLFYRQGYRDSEIAALVKLPVKTVQNILQKYVRVVRLKLGPDKGKGVPGE
jgi:RNA polymerase sigma factor (sigma-70 family)